MLRIAARPVLGPVAAAAASAGPLAVSAPLRRLRPAYGPLTRRSCPLPPNAGPPPLSRLAGSGKGGAPVPGLREPKAGAERAKGGGWHGDAVPWLRSKHLPNVEMGPAGSLKVHADFARPPLQGPNRCAGSRARCEARAARPERPPAKRQGEAALHRRLVMHSLRPSLGNGGRGGAVGVRPENPAVSERRTIGATAPPRRSHAEQRERSDRRPSAACLQAGEQDGCGGS